jgi:hypothetical protein
MKKNKEDKKYFKRLLSRKYACKHYILLTVGILSCALQGSILPIYGVLMSKLLFVLNHPN